MPGSDTLPGSGGGAPRRASREAPELSVILLIGKRRARAERALHSLLAQSAIDRMEILLVDYAAGRESPVVGSDHRAVRPIDRRELEPFGRIRAEAVRRSRAPIVAFLEEHCIALPGWADAIIRAHAQGWDGVGPEVHTANPGLGVSDSIALMNYLPWIPPASPGETEILVGNNSSYRRGRLLENDADLDWLMACDPLLQWRLASRGGRLAIDPDVKVAHWNEGRISTISRGYYIWNRIFGPMRAALSVWSPWTLGLRFLLLPAVPLVRAIQLGRLALRRRPSMGREFVRALPTILAAQTAAALGMGVGWILGPGDAETRFLEYELEEDRPEPDPGATAAAR